MDEPPVLAEVVSVRGHRIRLTLRQWLHISWKERPLQCPRCQSAAVDPWGNYHY